jgi:hypothetical protein
MLDHPGFHKFSGIFTVLQRLSRPKASNLLEARGKFGLPGYEPASEFYHAKGAAKLEKGAKRG